MGITSIFWKVIAFAAITAASLGAYTVVDAWPSHCSVGRHGPVASAYCSQGTGSYQVVGWTSRRTYWGPCVPIGYMSTVRDWVYNLPMLGATWRGCL